MQLHLKVTTFCVLKRRENILQVVYFFFLNHEIITNVRNVSQIRVNLQSSFNCMNSSGENSPNFPDVMESQEETTWFSGGGSTFWPALCAEHLHGSIKRQPRFVTPMYDSHRIFFNLFTDTTENYSIQDL